jgi:Tfp pilus assembly protein PilN
VIRIDLLPPEIIQKRVDERRWVYILFGGVAVAVIVFIFFGVVYLEVLGKRSDMAAVQQELERVQREAEDFRVFEDREADLGVRQTVVDQALAGRIPWSSLLTEISLVMPSGVWLDNLKADEKALTFDGQAIDRGGVDMGGYKNISRVLVRVSDLEGLRNVWLGSSSRSTVYDKPVMKFTITADVKTPAGGTTASTTGK